ncbi:hypothetical protein Goe24_01630 [Bacillus phage vB_BsuM-Goe24]|uniref:Uncharacterized protein n=1 Tax=Bacillus phage vB_BsuM-Goe3 TaxID=1933063 RepID=A0A217ER99_BPGO3|nr:hypothetical protein HWB07_gp148 [Bacillus phage vB_BsuM-Goe3]APZ82622.1 hypothetical protein Goe3_c16100 [Bacillus phage vB_BsuM-Goe3]WCS69538.1 hypothetical protein Goe24_01630 [Bacillus phage vB_BsuM-Goe24]
MDLINFLQKRHDQIEEQQEILSELKYGLMGAEVTHQGKEVVIHDIDWRAQLVEINYDDMKYEWVSFGKEVNRDE